MNDERFKGMTALVTGASGGIGAETAFALASRGAFVLAHYHTSREEGVKLLNRIRAAGGEAELVQADLSQSNGIRRFVSMLQERKSPLDILINNAGSLVERTAFLDLTEELWDRVFTLNLTSAFLTSQAVLRDMVKRKDGVIVNISSVAARFGGGIGAVAYSSAKAALSCMTKGMAREFAAQGIRINAVSPGTIDTDYHRQFSSPQALEGVVKATPMGRLGTSAEVADVVVFLCSEDARFIQGQVIEVNGGFLMA
ncbi:MAG TPA: SDR family NAD(P)-dependent oxidoreductase [Terriglobia bacterium]|nr:SDR family NAD(P)-dependent oxidoreductase [Terriglobia bacterium]